MRDLSSLDTLLQTTFPEDGPAASVLALRDGDVVYERSFGRPDLTKQTRADGDTFFNIASCSKQFTAVAVLQLAEKGKLSLDDSVQSFFPEFRSDIWGKVTIAHLLSHSSGVPDARGYLTREQLIACDDTLACEYMLSLDRLNFAPGTAYEYINPTFTLCGKLIERVSGCEFAQYMRKNIFLSAGMPETQYFDPAQPDRIPRRAHAYERENDGTFSLYEYGQETCFATRPDGGIYSSVHELANWEKALRENALISAQSAALAFASRTYVSGSPYCTYQNRPNTWYGLGWFIEPKTEKSPLAVYHTGDNGGFKALLVRFPEENAFAAVLAARSDWKRETVKGMLREVLCGQ